MLTKNLPKDKLVSVLFIRLFLDGLAGIQLLFQGKITHVFAILKAHFHFYHLLGKNLKKRNQTQKTDYFYTKSIVWSYFVQKKKTFNRI
jgi:hypothetical protein